MSVPGVITCSMSSTSTPYDFWVFDLDGTLVDVEPSYAKEVLTVVGDRIGHELSEWEMAALWYGFGGTRDDLFAKKGIDPVQFWSTFHEVEDPESRAAATFIYEDADRILSNLDCPVGVVTHCQQYLTDPVLDHLDIRDWFDTVFCCTEESGWKPDPEPVQTALASMGVDTTVNGTHGVLVGDSPQDIGAAWNAGLDGVHVERHGHDRRGVCVLGDRRVTQLDELITRSGRSPALD